MGIRSEFQDLHQKAKQDYELNLASLEKVESNSRIVSPKGRQAVLVDNRYMIHLYLNTYHDLKTKVKGSFMPGDMSFINENK